jgi:hypothetical protein
MKIFFTLCAAFTLLTASAQYNTNILGTINATGYYLNGQPLGTSPWLLSGTNLYYNNGNVGIGTSAPPYKLTIAGSMGIVSDNVAFSVDDGSSARMGFIKKFGLDPVLASGSNNAIIFAQSNQANIYQNISTATITERMRVAANGNVGIGITAPAYNLDVAGVIRASDRLQAQNLWIESAMPSITMNGTSGFLGLYGPSSTANGLKVGGVLISDAYDYANPAKTDLIVKGRVGIGTPLTSNPNDYTLAVNGRIGAKDVRVENFSVTWPDYVFNSDYKLPSLQEVALFIKKHKHLQDVPSAGEVEKNGQSLAEMNAILLKKVEELTLYLISQDERISNLEQELEKH